MSRARFTSLPANLRPAALRAVEGATIDSMKLFRVTFAVPPSLNNAYTNHPRGGRILSAEAKKYKAQSIETAESEALYQRFRVPQEARLMLRLMIYFPNRQRRDLSNCVKLAEDSLAKALGFDDSQIDRVLVVRGEPDKSGARCEIELEVMS